MLPVVTTLVGTVVKISWSPNTNNNGSPISAYEIKILTSSGVYIKDDLCDGTNIATI